MKTILLTFTALIITVASFAQSHIFSVLANKGTNKINPGTSWKSLKTGDKLYKGYSLEIEDNGGYIGLMHKTGKTVELKTKGTYTIADLENKIQSSSSSYAERYTNFALNMDGSSASSYNYNVTGSVERGGTYNLFSDDTIKIIKQLPLVMPWATDNKTDKVELRVINLFNETLYASNDIGQNATIDLSKTNINANEFMAVNLFDPNSIDEDPLIQKSYKLSIVNDTEAKQIMTEYSNLIKELNLNSSLDHMILASFFVEKNLSNYASSHLFQAHKLSPEISDYKGAFYKYLESEGIVTKIK